METIRKGSKGDSVKSLQECLLKLGFDIGTAGADGDFGSATDAAVRQFQSDNALEADGVVGPKSWEALSAQCPDISSGGPEPTSQDALVWGKKVSPEFKEKVKEIAANLGTDPNYLMAAMAFESAESFSPSKKNAAGSGAVGLIQFMPQTARNLGTTTEELEQMTAEEQLTYVERYLTPFANRLTEINDVYMAILWPAAVGKSPESILFDSEGSPKTYELNRGLDADKDGKVTKAEASSPVRRMLDRGRSPEFFG